MKAGTGWTRTTETLKLCGRGEEGGGPRRASQIRDWVETDPVARGCRSPAAPVAPGPSCLSYVEEKFILHIFWRLCIFVQVVENVRGGGAGFLLIVAAVWWRGATSAWRGLRRRTDGQQNPQGCSIVNLFLYTHSKPYSKTELRSFDCHYKHTVSVVCFLKALMFDKNKCLSFCAKDLVYGTRLESFYIFSSSRRWEQKIVSFPASYYTHV